MRSQITLFICIVLNISISGVTALNMSSLPIEFKQLYMPPLEDIQSVIQNGLSTRYEESSVQVVDCPDLTQSPYNLAASGLGGNPIIIDLGGPPYLLPLVNREKVYDLKQLATVLQRNPAFIVGAGAGPFPSIGTNCEGIYNLLIKDGNVNQQSHISKIIKPEEVSVQEKLPNTETRCALLANLYVSEGLPGKVLKVSAKRRISSFDFITDIRNILRNQYNDQTVALGGAFLIKQGKVRQHVMDDFSETPINTDEELNDWLYFFNMSAPLVALGTLMTNDMGLDVRVQHFHSFSDHNEAGHYHEDTTPSEVEYEAYFNVAEYVYRIDRPVVTHQLGRD